MKQVNHLQGKIFLKNIDKLNIVSKSQKEAKSQKKYFFSYIY